MSDTDSRNEKACGTGILGNGIWEHFSVRDGMPDMKVECIAQDAQGRIWVGTHESGVARADGDGFTCFNRDDGLAGNGVYSITEDGSGNLWFGTNRGLTVFDGAQFDSSIASGVHGLLWGSCLDQRGDLWFGLGRRPGRSAAVCRWNGVSAELFAVGDIVSEFGESIHAIYEGRDGILWLGGDSLYGYEVTSVGLMRCNHRFPGVFRVQDIQADEEGMVIADHWGIWRIADGEASLLSKLPAPGANAIVIDPVSGQWIACGKSGLTLIKGVDQQIIREFRRPIQSVYVDSDARLWVGTYGLGLYRWDQNVWRVYHDEGVDQIDPNCIAPTADGGVVVGTSDGFWWSSDGDTLEELDLGLQPEHRNITAVCVSGLRVWIGGRGGWAAQVVEGGYGVIVRSCGSGGRATKAWTAERKRAYPQGDQITPTAP